MSVLPACLPVCLPTCFACLPACRSPSHLAPCFILLALCSGVTHTCLPACLLACLPFLQGPTLLDGKEELWVDKITQLAACKVAIDIVEEIVGCWSRKPKAV